VERRASVHAVMGFVGCGHSKLGVVIWVERLWFMGKVVPVQHSEESDIGRFVFCTGGFWIFM
jgi:hypothetical protein